MSASVDDLKLLSQLLDAALELDASEREAWLASLTGDAARLGPALRTMLSRPAAGETGNPLDRVPVPGVAAPVGSEPVAGQRVGPYRLLRELGRGGMGAVWLAERADGQLRRKVALKLPHLGWTPGLAERFARERDILSALEHPLIARLYDAGVDEHGRPFMALEYVDGVPIDTYCARHALDLSARLGLLLQVVEAVAYAHSRLVVHRDLKPGNILVTAQGQVRLLDFGIAKLVEGPTAAETELTRAGGRALTLHYASPEQIRGEPIGTPSDVYSLGIVAFELLAGQRPYKLDRADVPPEQQVLSAEIPQPSATAVEPDLRRRLRGDLDAIICQALRKQPGARYATVDALASDLRAYLQGKPVRARGDGSRYRFARHIVRHRTPLAAGAGIAALFALGIGFGATAMLALVLAVGLGAALWQARAAARERDHALRLVERHEAVSFYMNTLLTDAAQGGEALTAQQLLERSEQLIGSELEHDPEVRAMVLSMIGTSMHTLGNPAEAVRLNEKAVALLDPSSDAELQDAVRACHAVAIGWAGRSEEARATLESIANRPTARLDRRAEAHHYLANLANASNDAPAALMHAEQALRLLRAQRKPSRKMEASALASLGAACSLNGRIAEADRNLSAAFALLKQLGRDRTPQAVTLLNNWAVICERAGDAQRSLALAEQALDLGGAQGRSPFLLANRARALEDLGRLDDAEAAYREGRDLAQRRSTVTALSAAQIGLASVDQRRGHIEAARMELDRVVLDAPAFVAEHPLCIARQLLEGRIALDAGDPAAARSAFEAALAAAPNQASAVMARLGLADAALAQGDPALAIEWARAAKDQADELKGGKARSFRAALASLTLAQALAADAQAAPARAQARSAVGELLATVDPSHPAVAAAQALARNEGGAKAA